MTLCVILCVILRVTLSERGTRGTRIADVSLASLSVYDAEVREIPFVRRARSLFLILATLPPVQHE